MAKGRLRSRRISYAAPLLAASLTAALLLFAAIPRAPVSPAHGQQTVLPVGTELTEDALSQPREIFKSEAIGNAKSYLVNLGDLAFSSPTILGGLARAGLSTRPGTFDTTGGSFNGKADNHPLDPVRIPSRRGARYLAPYGHDGRMASLRDFVRNVIVSEFAGPEPSAMLLDAIVVYIQDIDFLSNLSLRSAGRLTAQASAAEGRGEILFSKPLRTIRGSVAPVAMCPRPLLSIIGEVPSGDCRTRK